jgi:hypothetical protein
MLDRSNEKRNGSCEDMSRFSFSDEKFSTLPSATTFLTRVRKPNSLERQAHMHRRELGVQVQSTGSQE